MRNVSGSTIFRDNLEFDPPEAGTLLRLGAFDCEVSDTRAFPLSTHSVDFAFREWGDTGARLCAI